MATKASYKNVLLTPYTEIYSIPSGELTPVSFLQRCVTRVIEQNPNKVPDHEWQLIIEIEEEEIEALQNPSSKSYKNLKSTLNEAARIAKTNIVVYMGHMEVCLNYVKTIDLNQLLYSNGLPTCVFIIACYSDKYISELNQKAIDERLPIYFFGFETLMHMVEGEAYMCKETHKEIPNLDCVYPGSKEEIDALFAGMPTNNPNSIDYYMGQIVNNELLKPFQEQNKVIQCCSSKYERFRKVFLETLNKRDCAKFTAQDIAKKCKTIEDPDFMTKELYRVKYEDGTPCSKEKPCKMPTAALEPFVKSAKEYNNLIKAKVASAEIHQLFQNTLADYRNKEKNDLRMVQILASLTKEERKTVLEESTTWDEFLFTSVPIFYEIFKQKYVFSMKDIFQRKEINLDKSISYTITSLIEYLISTFVYSGNDFKNENLYTEKELYRLFQQILTLNRDIFWYANKSDKIPLSILLESKIEYPGLINFFFDNFTEADYYMNNSVSLLSSVLQNPFWDSHQKLKTLEKLFIFGVEQKNTHWIPIYESNEILTLNPEVLFLLYSTGFNIKRWPAYSASERVKYFEDCLKPKSAKLVEYKSHLKQLIRDYGRSAYRPRYNSNNNSYNDHDYDSYGAMISAYEKEIQSKKRGNFIDRQANLMEFIENAYKTYTLVQTYLQNKIFYPLDYEVEKKKIATELAPYREGQKAIDDIKQYFGTLQKQIKKKPLSPGAKQIIFEQLKAIYNSQVKNENEGNSALRKMNEMRQRYNALEQSIQTKKRALNLVKQGTTLKKYKNPQLNRWGVGGRRTTLRRLRTEHRMTRKH